MGIVAASAVTNIGFLTVLREASGYLGGYLVTNAWGRPLEFRLTTAIQPNRVQQLLYGDTLEPYVCADLIGKTLLEKTTTTVQIILTDCKSALDLRGNVAVPVACITDPVNNKNGDIGEDVIIVHPSFPDDARDVRVLLDHVNGAITLSEPFIRIRDAIGEARKMGVTARG